MKNYIDFIVKLRVNRAVTAGDSVTIARTTFLFPDNLNSRKARKYLLEELQTNTKIPVCATYYGGDTIFLSFY